MFGNRYFGARYFGDRFFGVAADEGGGGEEPAGAAMDARVFAALFDGAQAPARPPLPLDESTLRALKRRKKKRRAAQPSMATIAALQAYASEQALRAELARQHKKVLKLLAC